MRVFLCVRISARIVVIGQSEPPISVSRTGFLLHERASCTPLSTSCPEFPQAIPCEFEGGKKSDVNVTWAS